MGELSQRALASRKHLQQCSDSSKVGVHHVQLVNAYRFGFVCSDNTQSCFILVSC